MKKCKLLFVFTLIFSLFFLLCVTSSFSATFNWKVSSNWAPDQLESRTVDHFVDLVNEKSNGEIKLTYYPSGQLGNSLAVLEMLQAGEIEVAVDTSNWLTRLTPELDVLSFPYAIRDNEHLARIQKSEWYIELKKKTYETKGINILADNGFRLPRHLYTKTKGIITPEDLKGVKLRMPDVKVQVETWGDLGADISIVPWQEVATSIATGLLDGADGPATSLYSMKFYEVAPHITLTGHTFDFVSILVSRIHWEKLPPELQQIMASCATEALVWFTDEVGKVWEADKAKMTQEGAKFYEIDKEVWMKKILEIAKKSEEKGQLPEGLFEKIQNM
ncbi:MAG: TRAP transporter substrate-binding protein [Candidatus Lokiarchaeota archaeon]|nr:TRAP transporter substrate-binding protein [Candidatus Lokiarchaeota archaeon]